MDQLFLMLFISLCIQAIFFVFAFLLKTDKVTDLSYGLSFFIIACTSLYLRKDYESSNILLTTLISVWALRITGYLFIRILKMKRDKRFDDIRESFKKFSRFWILQGITVWVILLPALLYMQSPLEKSITFYTIVGIFIFAFGLIIETIADSQKFSYKKTHPDKWTNIGLWKYSRHPNYFGEMLCWWGIFVYCLPYLNGWNFLAILGPIFITFLLLFVSGIPPLEKSYEMKYGSNKQYTEYRTKTNSLVPLPFKLF